MPPTLMKRQTFENFRAIRSRLAAGPLLNVPTGELAGVFVPWAGSRLRADGGIYYVGMATNGPYCTNAPNEFDERARFAESLCITRDRGLVRTPFWQFLDGMAWALLGGPFNERSERFGWSNLLKIGWSDGNPNQWRPPIAPLLIDEQREACVTSILEELENLHDSLIVIATANAFGVLEDIELFPRLVEEWQSDYQQNWQKSYYEQTGVWWFKEVRSRNLYVHCFHPGYAVRASDSFWGSALGRIINLAQDMPAFA